MIWPQSIFPIFFFLQPRDILFSNDTGVSAFPGRDPSPWPSLYLRVTVLSLHPDPCWLYLVTSFPSFEALLLLVTRDLTSEN